MRQFQMPLEGLSFVKTLETFGFIYATDPLLQNLTKIVCLSQVSNNLTAVKIIKNLSTGQFSRERP